MGLLKATSDALGGAVGDQWREVFVIPESLPPGAAMFAAVPREGESNNVWGTPGVITNGSRIFVPQGYALLLFEGGGITGYVMEPGAYVWHSEAAESHSVFDRKGIRKLAKSAQQRMEYGGRAAVRQQAFYIPLKPLPDLKFGTVNPVYWDDSYVNAQVGGHVWGSYTVRVSDPIRFVHNWVPARWLEDRSIFDLGDRANPAARQLFTEIVSCLSTAFAIFANAPGRGNRMTQIQQETTAFSAALRTAVEETYQWSSRGLEVVGAAVAGIEYDEQTRDLLKTIQRADALSGARGESRFQTIVADGLQQAIDSGQPTDLVTLALASRRDPGPERPAPQELPASSSGEQPALPSSQADLVGRLTELKGLLDSGLISQGEFDTLRARALGL